LPFDTMPRTPAGSAWALLSWPRRRVERIVSIESVCSAALCSAALASLIYCHFAQRSQNKRVQRCKLK